MNLFSKESEGSFNRLLRSLSGQIVGGNPIGKQTAPLTEDLVTRVLGTSEDFMRKI